MAWQFLISLIGGRGVGAVLGRGGGGALDYARQAAIEDMVYIGIDEALATMEGMVGNAGQQSIFETYISSAFPAAAEERLIGDNARQLDIDDIDMPYKEAVEIILQTGCDIVNGYYEEAQDKDLWFDYL